MKKFILLLIVLLFLFSGCYNSAYIMDAENEVKEKYEDLIYSISDEIYTLGSYFYGIDDVTYSDAYNAYESIRKKFNDYY